MSVAGGLLNQFRTYRVSWGASHSSGYEACYINLGAGGFTYFLLVRPLTFGVPQQVSHTALQSLGPLDVALPPLVHLEPLLLATYNMTRDFILASSSMSTSFVVCHMGPVPSLSSKIVGSFMNHLS